MVTPRVTGFIHRLKSLVSSLAERNTSLSSLSLPRGCKIGKTLDEEGIWRFATDCKVFYFMHPENAIIKSVVFRLFDLVRLQNIFHRKALLF